MRVLPPLGALPRVIRLNLAKRKIFSTVGFHQLFGYPLPPPNKYYKQYVKSMWCRVTTYPMHFGSQEGRWLRWASLTDRTTHPSHSTPHYPHPSHSKNRTPPKNKTAHQSSHQASKNESPGPTFGFSVSVGVSDHHSHQRAGDQTPHDGCVAACGWFAIATNM